MSESRYGIASFDDAAWSSDADRPRRAVLTEVLGATETRVDAYRFEDGDRHELEATPEQLLVTLEGSGELAFEDIGAVGPTWLARVPSGVDVTIRSTGEAAMVVVSVATEPTPDDPPSVIDLAAVEYTIPSTSDIATAFLTGPLGLSGMKANARRLHPDQLVPYHTEGTQEELFIPISGPASLRVDDETYPLSAGTVARVAPPVPRSAVNPGDTDALWVMIGAPPTGGPTDWDPGAEILD